jgi:hypothetical protein
MDAQKLRTVITKIQVLSRACPETRRCPGQRAKDHYKNVRPVTLPAENNTKRLLIGTLTCDILVTGCIGFSNGSLPSMSVGGSAVTIEIQDNDSSNWRLILDDERVHQVVKLAEMSFENVTKEMGIAELRQLRNKFHMLDTYGSSVDSLAH